MTAEYIYRAEPIGEGEYSHTLVGELVRCGECEYWRQVDSEFGRCAGGYMNKDMRTSETWFCAGGVRRADDE